MEEQEVNDNQLLWKMFFDGSSSKEGAGAGIILVSPDNHIFPFSYKLEFETTNNIAEYEALILGLKATKDMNVKKLVVFGDSELVVLQIRNRYQAKQFRLKQYRDEVLDLIQDYFSAFNISFIPRIENFKVDSLALAASNFKVPLNPQVKYEV